MKLAILGGGGVRMPELVHALLGGGGTAFEQIALFEPDPLRRETTARLAVEIGALLGQPDAVSVSGDVEEAFSGANFVFSAIRVGGDAGRVIDEQVALRRGLVGQETTGAGGCAMALRTIPVVLGYCEVLRRVAPRATLLNFTNPAGIITQAIAAHGGVRAVGVCDTPSGTIELLAAFLGAGEAPLSCSYAGLNHLGWISSFRLDGEERIDELVARYGELQRFDHRFAALDAQMVRRLGAIPTEYVFYYYDSERYVEDVRRAGTSRGEDVQALDAELLAALARAFSSGDVRDAWATYSRLMGVRRDTYMRTDTEGASGQAAARRRREQEGAPPPEAGYLGGYAGVALDVIAGLTGERPGEVIVNTVNGTSLPFLAADDVVEVPALVQPGGLVPLATAPLPASARGLVTEVKEYERAVVEAAVTGDAGLAALALSMHPLVPGITVARQLIAEYRQLHGEHLAYLR